MVVRTGPWGSVGRQVVPQSANTSGPGFGPICWLVFLIWGLVVFSRLARVLNPAGVKNASSKPCPSGLNLSFYWIRLEDTCGTRGGTCRRELPLVVGLKLGEGMGSVTLTVGETESSSHKECKCWANP